MKYQAEGSMWSSEVGLIGSIGRLGGIVGMSSLSTHAVHLPEISPMRLSALSLHCSVVW